MRSNPERRWRAGRARRSGGAQRVGSKGVKIFEKDGGSLGSLKKETGENDSFQKVEADLL